MTDEENVLLELVAPSQQNTEARIEELGECGVEVNRTEFLTREVTRPFARFGEQFTDEE